VSDPWKDCTNGWGPGTLEDFRKLTGQSEQPANLEEIFNIFIQRNVDTDSQGHLLDTDDNDGEYVRRAIRAYVHSHKETG